MAETAEGLSPRPRFAHVKAQDGEEMSCPEHRKSGDEAWHVVCLYMYVQLLVHVKAIARTCTSKQLDAGCLADSRGVMGSLPEMWVKETALCQTGSLLAETSNHLSILMPTSVKPEIISLDMR